MSDLDLTEIVEHVAREDMRTVAGMDYDALTPIQQFTVRERLLPLVAAAAPLIEAQVREDAEDRLRLLVQQLQVLCDDTLLRRRDRLDAMPGARAQRGSPAGEAEIAATHIRALIKGLPGYVEDGTAGAYLAWCRAGRDEGGAR